MHREQQRHVQNDLQSITEEGKYSLVKAVSDNKDGRGWIRGPPPSF